MAKVIIDANVKEIVKALSNYGTSRSISNAYRKIGFDLTKATAYETTPEEYGKAYKSKKNGRDLVLYVDADGNGQALIFGRDFTEAGLVVDRVYRYGSRKTRSFNLYAQDAVKLVVIPQKQVIALQEEMVNLRRARKQAQHVDEPASICGRLHRFKTEKMNAIDLDSIKNEAKAAIVDLLNYVDCRNDDTVYTALRSVRESSAADVISDLAQLIQRATDSDEEYQKHKDGDCWDFYGDERNKNLLRLRTALETYKGFKAALAASKVNTAA